MLALPLPGQVALGSDLVTHEWEEGRGQSSSQGLPGSACKLNRSSHTALSRDLPLKEALFHIQAVDSEVLQRRIIQIDISN